MDYNDWLHEVDELCWSMFGVSVNDMQDAPFMDRFEEGYSPKEFIDLELMREREETGYYDFFE